MNDTNTIQQALLTSRFQSEAKALTTAALITKLVKFGLRVGVVFLAANHGFVPGVAALFFVEVL